MTQTKRKTSAEWVDSFAVVEDSAKKLKERPECDNSCGGCPGSQSPGPSVRVWRSDLTKGRKTLMKEKIQPEAIEALVLMIGLAVILLMSCYAGWC